MIFIKQKGETCMIASAAMVLNTTEENIISFLGHDGSDIWWPDCKIGLRGVHIQEIQDYAILNNHAFVEIQADPCLAPQENPTDARSICTPIEADKRLLQYMEGTRGMLHTITETGHTHMVAWDGHTIYDPAKGAGYPLSDYVIISYFQLVVLS